jgi:hypothetical protein
MHSASKNWAATCLRRPTQGLLLVLIALGSVCVRPAAAENMFGVGNVQTKPGDHSVVVPIVAATDQPITLLKLNVTFDPGLCRMIRKQSIRGAGRVRVKPQEGGIGCPDKGTISVVLFDLTGSVAVPPGNGPIAEWVFDVRRRAPEAAFPLRLTVDAVKSGPLSLSGSATGGTVTIGGVNRNARQQRARPAQRVDQ